MVPRVLPTDEVERGFGSVGDSGVCLRTFGTLLKWMSERTCPAYIIMTVNDVSRPPPELTRKGRIDEIFGAHSPTPEEREEIFAIRLRLRNRDPGNFDLDAGAAATDTYSGRTSSRS